MSAEVKTAIFSTTSRELIFIDGLKPDYVPVVLPPGRHHLERIPNPYGGQRNWLVLAGTKIGSLEVFWRFWEDSWKGSRSSQITFEEIPNIPGPRLARALLTSMPSSRIGLLTVAKESVGL